MIDFDELRAVTARRTRFVHGRDSVPCWLLIRTGDDILVSLHRRLMKTRRRHHWFGVNGYQCMVRRAEAIGYVKAEMKVRGLL